MTVTDTSLEVYYSLDDDTLNAREYEVFQYIIAHPNCIAEEIYKGLGYDSPNSTSPRITELLDKGLIVRNGKRKTSTGRSAYQFCIKKSYDLLYTIKMAMHPSIPDLARIVGDDPTTIEQQVKNLVDEGKIKSGGQKIDGFTKQTVEWWTIREGVSI